MKSKEKRLGLKENWRQFSLLLIVNVFVGGMVGLERTILPELSQKVFSIESTSFILSFIIAFGIVKAITNYFTGVLANRMGRRNLLILGWLVAIPIPFILIFATNWNWVIFANVLLGINQGLTWSSTVVMKIDLVGQKHRGMAMGLNESFGYLSMAMVAYSTGWIAAEYGLRPYPFYQGIVFIALGLGISIFLIKDTLGHMANEKQISLVNPMKNVFLETTWTNNNLGSITQAGFVNNLNDGMVWGILPIILSHKGLTLKQIAIIVAIYPGVWGIGQLFTGKLSDHLNKKSMLFWGMILQGISLLAMYMAHTQWQFMFLAFFLGLGTAIVYPTFLTALSGFTTPGQRAQSIGVFRLWRDLGYAFGALFTIFLSRFFELDMIPVFIGGLTIVSGIVIKLRMD